MQKILSAIISNSWREDPEKTTRFWKNQVKFVNFLMKWVKLPIQNHILKTQNVMKLKFTHFPVIKNAFKRIELKIPTNHL